MSVEYYAVCQQCKLTAQTFRFAVGGYQPPNGKKIHDFFLKHNLHEGFVLACHEQEEPFWSSLDDDSGYVRLETFGDGEEPLPMPDY